MALVMLAMCCLCAQPAGAAQLKVSHEKFKAVSVRSDWCARVVAMRVEAASPAIFSDATSTLLQAKLVGGVRAIVSWQCPKAVKITFSGWSGGKLYFAGAAEKKNDWILTGLYAAPK